jgi:dTDP-4-amino-4,6-dideoxygalactose transaminase
MRVPMLDLTVQTASLRERILSRIARLADSGQFILGEQVAELERRVAESLGARHALGCSSGSDALVLALQALGVSDGDEIITTPFSFFATVESILRVGARPRFVDIDPNTFALDPRRIAAAVSPRSRALLGVHLYGHPAPAKLWRQAADERGLALIEDAAQAFGATSWGRAAGTFGTLGCFSFQPTKPLGAWGDAGMVVTDDQALAERCRRLRSHGAVEKHRHQEIGGNYRLDALQAAVLCEKLAELPPWLAARNARARAYDEGLSALEHLKLPLRDVAAAASFALYTVRVTDGRRDALALFLRERGVETAIHYPIPLHRQPALLELGFGLERGALPHAELAADEVLSLPMYPELGFDQLGYVVDRVREFFGA